MNLSNLKAQFIKNVPDSGTVFINYCFVSSNKLRINWQYQASIKRRASMIWLLIFVVILLRLRGFYKVCVDVFKFAWIL